MAPTTYVDVLVRNIRAARSRLGLDQADVVARMRALGYETWYRQTMGKVERAERRVSAEEILGLAAALETTVARLMTPLWEDKWIELPSGESLRVGAVVTLVTGELAADDSIPQDIHWYENKPVRTIIPPHEGEAVQWGTPAEEA